VKPIKVETKNFRRVEVHKSLGGALKKMAMVAIFSGSLIAITTTASIVTAESAGASQSGVCSSNSSIDGGSGQYDPICMSTSAYQGGEPIEQTVYGGVDSSASWTGHIEITDTADGYSQNFDEGAHAAGWIQANTATEIVTGCTTTSVTIWESPTGSAPWTNEGTVSGELFC
jgi:hypothetical protein